ncbi:hypothetical protein QL285_043641 [Trifolium repens]|nr:hypothetical protein QL285_043641 [Trifolium repens]
MLQKPQPLHTMYGSATATVPLPHVPDSMRLIFTTRPLVKKGTLMTTLLIFTLPKNGSSQSSMNSQYFHLRSSLLSISIAVLHRRRFSPSLIFTFTNPNPLYRNFISFRFLVAFHFQCSNKVSVAIFHIVDGADQVETQPVKCTMRLRAALYVAQALEYCNK